MRLSRPATLALGVLLAAPALAQAPQPQAVQQERMKACNAEAGQKKLSGDTRKGFVAACLAGKPATPATTAAPSTPAKPGATATEPAQAGLIDINTATKDQLDALPQIGAARAEAIIKGRPYRAKNELVERYIVPQNAYKAIQRKIVARQKS